MKLIVAIIRPERLEAVQAALNERDVYLMTVTDVRGCGRQRGYTEVYRGQDYQVRLLPKLKLEIAVNDAFVEATVEAIVHAARTPETLLAAMHMPMPVPQIRMPRSTRPSPTALATWKAKSG